MKNKKMLILIMAFFIGISGVIYSNKAGTSHDFAVESEDDTELDVNVDGLNSADKEDTTLETATEEDKSVFVYVCGCVKNPGVYKLEADKRIADAIKLAGGMTGKASMEYINQALKIEDGMKIYIPSEDEVSAESVALEQSSVSQTSDGNENEKVNINTADKSELTKVPGIGDTRAEAIIAYRQENGAFSCIEDIKKVSGIADGLFGRMKEYITV